MARKSETSIQLVTSGNYLEAALALVAKARRSIDILAFSWGIGSVSGRMSFDSAPYQPLLADGEFKDAILEMIARARKRIEFSIYFFDHREIERALIAAHERGVKITGFIHQHFSFAMPYIRRNRATISRMRAAGMEDLHFSDGSKFSHSKYIVCDREVIALGTSNWLVEDVELHPQLYVRLKDKPLAKELGAHLREQIAAHGASVPE